jgi:hypothetical protein
MVEDKKLCIGDKRIILLMCAIHKIVELDFL